MSDNHQSPQNNNSYENILFTPYFVDTEFLKKSRSLKEKNEERDNHSNTRSFNEFLEFLKNVYERPNRAEKGWGIFSFFKDGLITTCSWWAVLNTSHLIVTVFINGLKNLINDRYKQTLRNIFNYGEPKSFLGHFTRYYYRRLSYNLITGFLVAFAAHSIQIFSLPMFLHILTSRFLASSHFIVGAYEDHLIYKGLLKRKTVAHIGGILSTVGAILGNLDLAGIKMYGIRPGLIGLILSTSIIISGWCLLAA